MIADPPRAGLAREVIAYLAGDSPAPSASPTSPATPPRSPATWPCCSRAAGGWTDLRAFDAFPMTHHVECVATLTR